MTAIDRTTRCTARWVPPAADVISGVGGGGLMTAGRGARIHPGLGGERRPRAHAPRFCNTCGEEQPVLRSIGTLPCRCRDATNAPRAENGHNSRARDPIRGRSPAHKSDALLLTSEVMELAGISRSGLYRRMTAGTTDEAGRAAGRVASVDVQRWIAAKAGERPPG